MLLHNRDKSSNNAGATGTTATSRTQEGYSAVAGAACDGTMPVPENHATPVNSAVCRISFGECKGENNRVILATLRAR